MKKLHKILVVTGKVQGVGFRYSCINTARSLGITGYVKNLSDRNVYIEAEGSPKEINLFIEWCHEGPTYANVKTIKIVEGELCQYKSFELRK